MQSYSTLKAVTTRATVSGLKPGTRYVFQVRARTSAGCGRFSQAMEVETGKPRECREGAGVGVEQLRRQDPGVEGWLRRELVRAELVPMQDFCSPCPTKWSCQSFLFN